MTLHSISSASGKPELICVDPKRVKEIWFHVRHFIIEAMRRGDMGTFDALERDVLSGDALLWVVWTAPHIEAAVVTQIVNTESSRVCMIQACGGSTASRWVGLIARVEAYAKDQGCKSTRILGRKGWAKILKNYNVTKYVLERPL